MADGGVTEEERRQFVEEGYLWVRNAFSPERARAIVEGVFGEKGSLGACSKRTAAGHEPFEYTGQPLSDCREWDINRVDVETGFEIRIDELSPRLSAIIDDLCGTAPSRRSHVGEKWILNLDYRPDVPDDETLDRIRRSARWHIDTPGPQTSLKGRFDALTLLILWTDVEEHGGGTLFCPDSLDAMVEAMARRDEGINTKALRFANPLIAQCRDIRAQVGRAGDVLVTHPFMLHARPENYRPRVRILENPTVLVRRELDYHPDNPDPSPVEACVIKRLAPLDEVSPAQARRDEAASLERRAERALVSEYPAHFFPYEGDAEVGGARDAYLRPVDQFLFECWVGRTAHAVANFEHGLHDSAKAVMHLVRRLVTSQRRLPGMTSRASLEEPPTLADRPYATLVTGFMNCEGMSYLVGRLLGRMGYVVHPFETAPQSSHHHTALLAHDGTHGLIIDVWSDVVPFWVEGMDVDRISAKRNAETPIVIEGGVPDAPRYLSLSGAGGDFTKRGLNRREAYLGGAVLSPSMLAPPDIDFEAVRLFVSGPRRPFEGRSTPSWDAFLKTRAAQLRGTLGDIGAAYDTLLEDTSLRGATRRLVRELGRVHGSERAEKRSKAVSRPVFDLERRLRAGDVSAWPRWNPQPIAHEDMEAAWDHVFAHRGEPGVPSTIRAYTHFAYCAASCNFCMYWHEVPKGKSAYTGLVDYLVSRVEGYAARFGRQKLDSAYFGGGTPTATPVDELRRYLDAFSAAFEVQGEFSVEGHPGTTTREHLELLAEHGVNRLSMGIQSLSHEVLVRITRRNAPIDEVRALVEGARELGMVVNLDMILGLPKQTLPSFREDLVRLAEVGPDYITMYLYEPVRRLPDRPASEMTYEQALLPDVLAQLSDSGFQLADPLGPQQRSARLKRTDGSTRRFPKPETYAQFDTAPSHTLALGPGAFGHVFGRYWYREVTATKRLEELRPRFEGTSVTAKDEAGAIVLDALERGRPFRPARIEQITGVDVREAFSEGLSTGLASGVFEDLGEEIWARGGEGREAVIDRIVPKRPRVSLPVVREPGSEPALLAPRRDQEKSAIDTAAMVELRETLSIPSRGYQFCPGVWVGITDGASIAFHVGKPKAPPLQVVVAAPRAGARAYFANDRFSLSYRTPERPSLNDLERRFLAWLRAKIRALPKAAEARV